MFVLISPKRRSSRAKLFSNVPCVKSKLFALQWSKSQRKTRWQASTGIFFANYKQFDQLLQTVENKTTVLILVLKEFLQTIPLLIPVLYAKRYQNFHLKLFRLTVPKKIVEEPFCVSENFCY